MNKKEHLTKIKLADEAYYSDDGNAIMSDEEYDALRNSYIEKYGSEDLNYVPGKASTKKKYKHPIPVISLAKVDMDETEKIISEAERLSPIFLEPKYDGLTVVAYPDKNGNYFYVTRGSGIEGDILPWFPKQNKKHEQPEQLCPIRGEAIMTQSKFEKMNEILIARGEKPKANPRNAAAGILNPARKEKSEFLNLISYFCYDVIDMNAPETKKLEYIRKHTPFEATWVSCLHDCNNDFEQARKYIRTFMYDGSREKGIPVDGMVLKTD